MKSATDAGFTVPQAEFEVGILAKIFDEIHSIKHDVKTMKQDIKQDMRGLKKDLIITMGGMIAGAVVILPAVFKLINFI